MEMTPTEIILAITCAAIVLWLYIYAPKLINRLPKFRVEGTRREREQAYMDECWNEVEGKRRKAATATKTGKKGRKQKKIVKMKKQPGEYVIPVLVILVLLNMLIYELLN